jgi:hypothetical protein
VTEKSALMQHYYGVRFPQISVEFRLWTYQIQHATLIQHCFNLNMFPSLMLIWILNMSNLSEIQYWSIDIEVIFNVEVSKQVETTHHYMNLRSEYWRLYSTA